MRWVVFIFVLVLSTGFVSAVTSKCEGDDCLLYKGQGVVKSIDGKEYTFFIESMTGLSVLFSVNGKTIDEIELGKSGLFEEIIVDVYEIRTPSGGIGNVGFKVMRYRKPFSFCEDFECVLFEGQRLREVYKNSLFDMEIVKVGSSGVILKVNGMETDELPQGGIYRAEGGEVIIKEIRISPNGDKILSSVKFILGIQGLDSKQATGSFCSQHRCVLSEGQIVRDILGGELYEIEIASVGVNSVRLDIDGFITDPIAIGGRIEVENLEVKLEELMYSPNPSFPDRIVFVLSEKKNEEISGERQVIKLGGEKVEIIEEKEPEVEVGIIQKLLEWLKRAL